MRRATDFDLGGFIIGLLLTVLGIFTFIRPGSILTGAVIVYGIIAIIIGIEDIVIYARLSRFTGFGPMVSLVSGILSIMCGIMLVANPAIGKWALTVLFPIWFIAHCISGLTRTGFIRAMGNPFYYYFTLAMNIIGLILGFALLFSPVLSFMTLTAVSYLVAVYLIIFGIEQIIASFAHRNSNL